ncbi:MULTISPECIES: hypothetical protein [Heyndrickxia]|jgi:hypothetical protein|uniref:hypothetical protein n=1 Tax=Heyndrickxia TaxID=2837504 RepID=UPI00105F600E|nr:hypothetical protein [Heyndrickxia coagulans]MBF8417908.1 hypothetical protein [Heyndrickxia coagulans]UJZ86755.1 hypothetical protein L3V65_10720 [Heyndrickxia coagulans]
MNEVAIQELIELATARLFELQLYDGSNGSYRRLAFHPISGFYSKKSETYYRVGLMDEFSRHYQEIFHSGNISRKALRWRL